VVVLTFILVIRRTMSVRLHQSQSRSNKEKRGIPRKFLAKKSRCQLEDLNNTLITNLNGFGKEIIVNKLKKFRQQKRLKEYTTLQSDSKKGKHLVLKRLNRCFKDKVNGTVKDELANFVKEFGAEIFRSDGVILYCKHIHTAKHKSALCKKAKQIPKSSLISSLSYISTQKKKSQMKARYVNHESTDPCGRFIDNVVIGTMDYDQSSRIYLLACEKLDKTNSSTIVQVFTSALNILWPDGIKYDDVILFTSDAAAYMKKAGKVLKVLFPTCFTCLDFQQLCEDDASYIPNYSVLSDAITRLEEINKTLVNSVAVVVDVVQKIQVVPSVAVNKCSNETVLQFGTSIF
ncbi:hypothetical protein L9F63_002583, partial [Diploptera punctata]